MVVNYMSFKNLTDAWHGMNEYIANNEKEVLKKGGMVYGTEFASYDNIIHIDECKLDPKFNFGKILGYQDKKWSKLINNYCNLNYLDLVRNEIVEREAKRAKNYNHTYHFDNVHGSGKDCLIALTFTRRKTHPNPIVYYFTRASEITKRLAFDFLLIQRMCEYVYGRKQPVTLVCDIPFMYINLECFLMYVAYKGTDILKPRKGKYSVYQTRLLDKYEQFRATPLENIKYKVHTRAARQVQAWEGTYEPIPDMFAKDLKLFKDKRKHKIINKLNEQL